MNRSNLLLPLVFMLAGFACIFGTDPDDPPTNPRDYVWTVDTLSFEGSSQTSMRDIWGSSTTDVYVVGHNSKNSGLMWHFDGKEWADVKLTVTQGGNITGAIDLIAVYGFASDDVWAVGKHLFNNPNPPPNFLDSTLIIHYDGAEWREIDLTGRRITDVGGSSPDDVFFVGQEGTIFHYDGGKWSKEQLSYPIHLSSFVSDGNEMFMTGVIQVTGPVDTFMTFINRGEGWEIVDSQLEYEFVFASRFGLSLFSPEPGAVYSASWGVYRWTGSSWQEFFTSDTALVMGGNAEDNMYVVGQNGLAHHWNGADWQVLNIPRDRLPENVWLTGIWTDGREAFICGRDADGHQTYILHGK